MKSVKNLRYEEKTAKTDDSLEELQAELLRLQRQYRFLEEDRRTYREVQTAFIYFFLRWLNFSTILSKYPCILRLQTSFRHSNMFYRLLLDLLC